MGGGYYRGGSGLFGSGVYVHEFETEPSFTPGRSELLFTWDFVSGSARRMAVSANGARFLMLKDFVDPENDNAHAEVILVENWFEELNGASR